MNTVAMKQKEKIHPYKFNLWIGIGSIIMMFAGLTSAVIVKRNLNNWVTFEIPKMFWYSTVVILLSSVTLVLANKAFKQREMANYRNLVTVTTILGVLFLVFQVLGFIQLWHVGVTLQSSVSHSFMYVIVWLHGAHVVGGIIALAVLFAKAFSTKTKSYNKVSVDVVSTYWHFVDVLWIYLLLFLILIK